MWIDKLERKWGRFAIPHLIRYIVLGNVLVYLVGLINPGIYFGLMMIPQMVLKGQIWRIFTFILVPGSLPSMGNVLMTALSLYCCYWIGEALEATWGAFRFNLYYLLEVVATIAVSFIFKIVVTPSFINQMLFLALATLYPDLQLLFMYFIPMKAKWLGIISVGLWIMEIIAAEGSISVVAPICAAFVSYIIFFAPVVIQRIKNRNRRKSYEKAARPHQSAGVQYRTRQKPDQDQGKVIQLKSKTAFHRCHICGITELDDPNMTFRYCSQCNGNYEYCEKHLHNHEHVQ